MQISIPSKLSSGGSATAPANYAGFVDLNYNIFSERLLQFNIPTAFVSGADTSQAEWGLANLGARHSQNNTWNSAYTMALASGTGALTLNSITRSFVNDIKDVKSGLVKFSIFDNNSADKCLAFDDTNKRISSITNSANASSIMTGTQSQTGFIATNKNNFLIITDGLVVKSVPVDVNGNIIAGTINTYTLTGMSGASTLGTFVAVAKAQYAWITAITTSDYMTGYVQGWLLSVSSTGVITAVASGTAVDSGAISGGGSIVTQAMFGSYVKNNTAYCVSAFQRVSNNATKDKVFSIDLSNVAAFSITTIKDSPGTLNSASKIKAAIPVGWDGTNVIFTAPGLTRVYTCTAAGAVDTGYTPLTGYFMRYNNTVAKMSTQSLNFNSTSDVANFNYKGQLFLGYDTSIYNNIIEVFKMTGTNEQDDAAAVQKMIVKNATTYGDGLAFQMNGTTYGTDLIGSIGQFTIAQIYTQTAGTKNINFKLYVANGSGRSLKMGFGVTGGTYATPTGANNLSGDATNGWMYSAGGSYLDITIG